MIISKIKNPKVLMFYNVSTEMSKGIIRIRKGRLEILAKK